MEMGSLWHQPDVSSSFLSKGIGKKRTATRLRHNVTSDDLSTGNDATARRGYQAEYGMDRVETIQSSPNPPATDPNPVQSS